MANNPPESGSNHQPEMSMDKNKASEPNPSAKLLSEALPDAKQIQADLKAGNTSGLMKDALAVNNMKNPEFSRAVQADLAKLGFPDVAITTVDGAGGKFTQIASTKDGSNGSTTTDTYWAGPTSLQGGSESTGHYTTSSAAIKETEPNAIPRSTAPAESPPPQLPPRVSGRLMGL